MGVNIRIVNIRIDNRDRIDNMGRIDNGGRCKGNWKLDLAKLAGGPKFNIL